MLTSISKLSDSYKIALVTSIFFLVNALVSSNMVFFNSFSAYIIGFAIGLASAYVGHALTKRRRQFIENDIQIDVAIDLCKQLSALPARVINKAPVEIVHLIFASKAYYAEPSVSADLTPACTPVVPAAVLATAEVAKA